LIGTVVVGFIGGVITKSIMLARAPAGSAQAAAPS